MRIYPSQSIEVIGSVDQHNVFQYEKKTLSNWTKQHTASVKV